MDESAQFGSQPFDAIQPYRAARCADPDDDGSFALVKRRFSPGDRVRLCRGVFAGAEGTVQACCGESRLRIGLDLKQQGVSLEVDDASLEPIG